MIRLKLGVQAVFDLNELIFPNRTPNFQSDLCRGVLNVDGATFITVGINPKEQLLEILTYANRIGRIESVIQRCRTWGDLLPDEIDTFLARLGSTTDQVIPGPVAFFDRHDLRENLNAVLDPNCGACIVIIKGPSPSGKSHSFRLISRVGKGLAGASPQEFPLVDYTELEPVELMESIAYKLSMPKAEMPRSKRAQNPRIVVKLTDWFVGAFNNRQDKDKPVWLCLDGFHLSGCPQWAVDFAVNIAIARANGSIDNLVLFLIGFDETKLPSQCDGAYRVEEVTPFTREHVWEFVLAYGKSMKLAIEANAKQTIIDAVFKDIPDKADHAQMREVAQRAIKVVDRIKRTATEAAAPGGS
jgi:hypothetical protein